MLLHENSYKDTEKSSVFSLFVISCQNYGVSLSKKPLNFIIMSLWDWLLAAWIYEEIFDNDSNDRSCDNTCNHDSFRDYDYEDDFDNDF